MFVHVPFSTMYFEWDDNKCSLRSLSAISWARRRLVVVVVVFACTCVFSYILWGETGTKYSIQFHFCPPHTLIVSSNRAWVCVWRVAAMCAFVCCNVVCLNENIDLSHCNAFSVRYYSFNDIALIHRPNVIHRGKLTQIDDFHNVPCDWKLVLLLQKHDRAYLDLELMRIVRMLESKIALFSKCRLPHIC